MVTWVNLYQVSGNEVPQSASGIKTKSFVLLDFQMSDYQLFLELMSDNLMSDNLMSDNLISDNLLPDNRKTKKGHLSRQPIPNKLTQKNYLNYIF
jgi:hypothetical protein